MRADPRRRDPAAYATSLKLDTRFGDMDVNGHLNNVAFARLFEETRVRFLRFGSGVPAQRPSPSGVVVGHVAIDYLAEGNYPAPVTVTLAIGRIGTSSFTVAMAAFQNGQCIALCDSVLVHRDPESGPSPIPLALRERLEALRLRG